MTRVRSEVIRGRYPVTPHAGTSGPEPGTSRPTMCIDAIPATYPPGATRFRVYVGGRVVDEQWVLAPDGANPQMLAALMEACAARQATVATRAADQGLEWMAEIWDPNETQQERAYFRFGTDPDGMRDPHPTTWPDLIREGHHHPFFREDRP